MTIWTDTNTIETGWAGESEIIESGIKFNQKGILFNTLHISFNGQLDKKYINLIYTTHVPVSTAWGE